MKKKNQIYIEIVVNLLNISGSARKSNNGWKEFVCYKPT